MAHSYQQPVKNAVRYRVLTNAVEALTTDRNRSVIVQPEEVEQTVAYARTNFRSFDLLQEVDRELAEWRCGFESHLQRKEPRDLRVLYLCGPEPLNDLQVLLTNGIVPQNVWAVESMQEDVRLAREALAASYPSVRLHPGDLADLLKTYPGKFDIVYYDACASLFGPDVLGPITALLKEVRLEPLSVLVTNVSRVPVKYQKEYAAVLSAFFRYRYNDLPKAFWESEQLDPEECKYEDAGLQNYIVERFEPFYSEFVTRFVVDLARFWIPNCRALSLKAVNDLYLVDGDKIADYLERSKRIPPLGTFRGSVEEIGDIALSPSSYPLYSFYEDLKSRKHEFLRQLESLEINGEKLDHLLGAASLADAVFEGHWDAMSPAMLKAIALSWFDCACPFSCDTPLPNLIVNSLLGIYGNPYLVNCRASERLCYTAKATKMFTDILVLDQCRYYYDWFPTVLLAPDRFQSRGFQVVARCILDRIGRTDQSADSHPFRGAAVAALGSIPIAEWYKFPNRKGMTANDVIR